MNSAWNGAELSAIYIHVREPRRSFFFLSSALAVLARLSVLNVKLWKTPTNLPHFIFAPAAYSCPHRCIRDAITLNFPAFSDENKKLQRRWLVQFLRSSKRRTRKKNTEITYIAYYLVCMAKRVYGILSLFFRICRSGQWECNAATSTELSLFFRQRFKLAYTRRSHSSQHMSLCWEKLEEKKNLFPNNFFFCPFAFVHTLLSSYFFCCTIFNSFLCFCSLSLTSQSSSFAFGMLLFSSSSPSSPRRRLSLQCCVLMPRYILYCFLLSFEKVSRNGNFMPCSKSYTTTATQKKNTQHWFFSVILTRVEKKGFPWWSKGWHLAVRIVWIFLFSHFFMFCAHGYFFGRICGSIRMIEWTRSFLRCV